MRKFEQLPEYGMEVPRPTKPTNHPKATSPSTPVRVVALSGGGVKGAYQAGVLLHLMRDRGDRYDGYCGVSVGALNSAFLAMFPATDAAIGARELVSFWEGLTNKSVHRSWCPFGRVSGLWKPSLLNSVPLQRLVHEKLDPSRIQASGRKLRVGAVSLTTGEYRVFDETFPQLADAVLASSAFPGFLCPIEIEGQLWMDGGIKVVTPIRAAIDMGATDVDVIMCSPDKASPKFDSKPNALEVALRSIDLMVDQIIATDLQIAYMYNDLVQAGKVENKRHINFRVFRPAETLVEDSLDFDPAKIREMLNAGYDDARRGW